MFIRWQKYRSVALWHHGKVGRIKAVLVKAVRIDGEPQQKHIAFIASYEPDKIDQISTRSWFWRHARERLDHLGNQITPEDRSKIEAALAQRVAPTTAAEDAALQRRSEEAKQWLRERFGSLSPP